MALSRRWWIWEFSHVPKEWQIKMRVRGTTKSFQMPLMNHTRLWIAFHDHVSFQNTHSIDIQIKMAYSYKCIWLAMWACQPLGARVSRLCVCPMVGVRVNLFDFALFFFFVSKPTTTTYLLWSLWQIKKALTLAFKPRLIGKIPSNASTDVWNTRFLNSLR